MNASIFRLTLGFGILLPQFAAALPYPGRTPGNKLTASDAQDDDEFGNAVAISETLFLIGAPEEDGAGRSRGAAYLFDLSTGTELAKFVASDAGNDDNFGRSVAVSGNLALVGAPTADGDGIFRGAAYVFDLVTGKELRKLTPSDAEDADIFGASVALSGNLAIIGASQDDGDGIGRGSVYAFDASTGAELFKLTASDAADNDFFGGSVALSGQYVLVGARQHNNARGTAYVFDLTTKTELFELTASDGEAFDFFGGSVALSGNLALVGAINNVAQGSGGGAAYVFDVTTGAELFKLTASDGELSDFFGSSVAISGNLALVGATRESGAGDRRGAAYVFDMTTGTELLKLTASDAEDTDFFGNSVTIAGTLGVVGAFSADGAGAAYIFEIPDRRPDLLSGAAPFSGQGSGVFNTSGAGQTTALTSRRLAQVSGFFTLNSGGDTTDDYVLAATPGDANFALRYFRRNSVAETNATAALRLGTQLERSVAPGEAGRVYRAEVTPSKRLKKRIRGRLVIQRKTILARLTATSSTHASRKDAAAISVKTR